MNKRNLLFLMVVFLLGFGAVSAQNTVTVCKQDGRGTLYDCRQVAVPATAPVNTVVQTVNVNSMPQAAEPVYQAYVPGRVKRSENTIQQTVNVGFNGRRPQIYYGATITNGTVKYTGDLGMAPYLNLNPSICSPYSGYGYGYGYGNPFYYNQFAIRGGRFAYRRY